MSNPVLIYCEFDGTQIGSNANAWMRIDTTLLSVYDNNMSLDLNLMHRVDTDYKSNAVAGSIRAWTLPLPDSIRGVRVEYINLENENYADPIVNNATPTQIWNASEGSNVHLGAGFTHFSVTAHSADNANSAYLSNVSLQGLESNVSGVALWGLAGIDGKVGNANSTYFDQYDDVGFVVDRLVISSASTPGSNINIQDLRIWIR